MEQNPDTTPPTPDEINRARAFKTFPADAKVPAHRRFAALLAANGLDDGAAAALLMVSRPSVSRTRANTRSPSFDMAARIETLLGIPCAHWQAVPAGIAKSRAALAAPKRKAG